MSRLSTPRYVLEKICDRLREVLPRRQRNGIKGTGWLLDVQVLGSELDALGKSTEGEFLDIGEKLHNYHQLSEEISRISASVAQLMTGEDMDAVIDGFRNVISRVRGLESESRRGATALKELLATLSDLLDNLTCFHKTIRSLRILRVSTKIESTRLNGRDMGFNILAEEVGKLALEIESRHSLLLAATESMRNLVGHALLSVSDLGTRQHVQTGIILDKTASGLESLTEKHSQSSKGAARIAARYDSIARNIGEIVSSLQFHDIMRQRVEHVKKALDNICLEQELKQLSPAVGICELQIAQLQTTRDELILAVDNILDNLRCVAGAVSGIALETQAMAGTANATGDSFLDWVEADFSSITPAFSAYAEADRKLSGIMNSVGNTVVDMSTHINSIDTLKEKIKLIALNAIVKSCHIGDEGASLHVLSENLRQLSIETQQRTEKMSANLRSMTLESESLCDVINAHDEGKADDFGRIHEVVRDLLGTLRDVNQRIMALLARMHDKGLALSEDIEKVIDDVDVHHRVANVIDTVVSRLDEKLAPLRSLYSIDGRSEASEHIKALETSYTMHSEREVHSALLGGGGTHELPGSKPLTLTTAKGTSTKKNNGDAREADEEDFGDNVELF